MRSSRRQRVWSAVAIAVLLMAAPRGRAAQKQKAAAADARQPAKGSSGEPVPAARIAVDPLGYAAPNPSYLNLRLSLATLNFIDRDHLLFTFHVNKLLQRIPGDPATDDDQLIHVVVLDITTGKALREADWRLHDKGRYLWALKDGKFLVRVRNSLFLMDRSLELRPYLTFDTDLQGVEVSPGRGLLMLEVKKYLAAKEGAEETAPSLFGGNQATRRVRTQMALVRPGERKELGGAEMMTPAYVPLLEDGILDVDEGKKPNDWAVVEDKLDKTTKVVGTVQSLCTPQLVTLSDDVVLSQACPQHGDAGKAVSALSMQGDVLWQDRWESKYIWPEIESSQDGSRFVYETLEMNREVGALDYFGEADVVAQPVGVFDTLTGKLVLVEDASPALSAGQNFALSADGRRFAILRKGAIEVYDLPPVLAAAPAKEKRGKK